MLPGARFTPRNDIAALEQVVSDRTAGIVLELVQGEGGIYPLDVEYVRKARELADRHNALLVFDETQCGVGRTGTYFSYQLVEPVVMPDVMVAAKPIACGLPLGFVAATDERSRQSSHRECTAPPSAEDRSRAASLWNSSTSWTR